MATPIQHLEDERLYKDACKTQHFEEEVAALQAYLEADAEEWLMAQEHTRDMKNYFIQRGYEEFQVDKMLKIIAPYLLLGPAELVRQITIGCCETKDLNAAVSSRASFILDLLAAKGVINEEQYRQLATEIGNAQESHLNDEGMSKYSPYYLPHIQKLLTDAVGTDQAATRVIRAGFRQIRNDYNYGDLFKREIGFWRQGLAQAGENPGVAGAPAAPALLGEQQMEQDAPKHG